MKERNLGFSIVLCTNNGEARLSPTLAHLSKLLLPDDCGVELIVVDNASTDNTAFLVENNWKSLGEPFPLRVLSENRPGKGYAVETGYDAAQYTYILTVDDDNWLQSDYLVNALEILKQDPEIGVLQGQSEGVFETPPPPWVEKMKELFIIGSPIQDPGYFPKNDFSVWGAGMVILKRDWEFLRKAGFSALTSKLPGKAAGEDNEAAMGILMLGRKIYYSEKLKYKHFMPAARVNWQKLKMNFVTSGYVGYYMFLYALVFDAYEKGYPIKNRIIRKKFFRHYLKTIKPFTLKHHIAAQLKPLEEPYQLELTRAYSLFKWFFKLSNRAKTDIHFLQSWILPLLERNKGAFEFPWKLE